MIEYINATDIPIWYWIIPVIVVSEIIFNYFNKLVDGYDNKYEFMLFKSIAIFYGIFLLLCIFYIIQTIIYLIMTYKIKAFIISGIVILLFIINYYMYKRG